MKEQKRIYGRKELLDLVNKEHSCITLKHCNRKIELRAKYLKDVKTGIRNVLDSCLNKFDFSLNGILMDYQDVSVVLDEWSGRIVGRNGEFLVIVTADFYVFDPKIGSVLEGVVNVKSNTHVGCLVHKKFNAMILKPDIEEIWDCENIQIGDKIMFTVVDYVVNGNIPIIEGVLAADCIEKDLTENGKFDDLDALVGSNKRTSKSDEADSSISRITKHENDLVGVLGFSSVKSKSRKRKIDPLGILIDNMDVIEPKLQFKRKKKSKGKNETFETEKPLEPFNASSIAMENPASVISETVIPMTESEFIQIKPKKKRDKEKELYSSRSNKEKKKKKKDKNNDRENDVFACLETVEKEKHHDNTVVKESVPKSKEKKKRKIENSSLDILKTGEQCELSPSKQNRLCIDDNIEPNDSPVFLIDQLMEVLSTDLTLPSETSPVKGTSLEKLKSPKLGDVRKNETPEKSLPPSEKKREGLMTDITSKSPGVNVEDSPTKKRHSRESLMSPKSVKQSDKSMLSGSEGSGRSPQDKKDSRNKSVTGESQNVTSRGAESKTTLLQRFEECLGDEGAALIEDFVNKSETAAVKKDGNETEGPHAKKKSNGDSPAAKGSSNKKAEPERRTNKLVDNVRQSMSQNMLYSLGDGTWSSEPVETSTPKMASYDSDYPEGRIKKRRTKKVKKALENDDRDSIINALLKQAKESLGIGELFQEPSKTAKK